MAVCGQCGTPVNPDQRFCTNCGADIVPPAPPPAPAAEVRPLGPAHRSPGTRGWAIAAAVVVVLAGVAAFLLTQGGGTGRKAAAATTTTSVTPTLSVPPTTDTPTLASTPPSPTDTPTDTPTPTPSPTATGPAGVVQAYFAAINSGDYGTAWNLGGSNLDSSYAHFAQGFTGTKQDTVTVTGVSGDIVEVQLTAIQNDGPVLTFAGSYTVENGKITQANLSQTG